MSEAPRQTSSRPNVQIDPSASAINQPSGSSRADSPQSAIIEVPSGWNGSPASTNRGSMDMGRASLDSDSRRHGSTLSTSSFASIDSSSRVMEGENDYRRPELDPFHVKTFSEDPFAQQSSGEDDASSNHNSVDSGTEIGGHHDGRPPYDEGRRGSVVFIPHNYRSITDPLQEEGHPLDTELSGSGPPQDGYELDHPHPPTFHRTFSAPLPQRVGYLRHPLSPLRDYGTGYNVHAQRNQSFSATDSPTGSEEMMTARPLPPNFPSSETAVSERIQTPLEAVSLELADGLQSAIQTLLHLSPPHLLDNAKEQYSGCTVQIPSTSLSALLSSMRGLNYLSANVQTLCDEALVRPDQDLFSRASKHDDFDIGELLQSVADLLGGQAGQAGVDFVLFHGDVGIKHVSVKGDCEGLAYALGHIVRQMLAVANKGDTIELGLQVIPQSPSMTPRVSLPLTAADVDEHRRPQGSSHTRPASPGRTLPSPPAGHENGPLLCIFEIVHNLNQTSGSAAVTPKAELNPFTRLQEQSEAASPKLDTIFCRRLLASQNASLKVDAQPSSPLGNGLPRRVYELSVLLPRGGTLVEPAVLSLEEEAMRQPFAGMKLAREPTLGELSDFADSLRGKKVTLHASLTSLFARHLTSYLAAWGLDISHIPIEDQHAFGAGLPEFSIPGSRDTAQNGSYRTRSLDEAHNDTSPGDGKFIIIDDDVAVLRRELTRIRAEAPVLSFKPRLLKRPTLVNRTRSSPHVRQAVSAPPHDGPVIIHFTSLSKYNQVRDIISSLLGVSSPTTSSPFVHPEVMVIPKPVGPRRFLTALHTAVNKPIVDPFFSPIATSPRSPGGGHFTARTPLTSDLGKDGGFFDSVAEEDHLGVGPPGNTTARSVSDSSGGSQKARSPLGEFPPSHASVVRTEQGLHLSIPTPGDIMATPASEYFSNAASRASSASGSAVIMQSPDGRPVGMFFEPPNKEGRRVSYNRHSSERRKTATRRASGTEANDVSKRETPQEHRRGTATTPTEGTNGSRRGSMRDTDGAARASLRRRTLPTPVGDNAEPIVAVGRERSSTLTGRRQNTQVRPSPHSANSTASLLAPPSRSTQKLTKKADPSDDVKVPPVGVPAAKKAGQDVVVPPINVLIVEDNPINQNILSMFLRKKKINHQTAKDGLEAVEKWRTGAFHLILMDIQLPVMDGIEATKEIRKLEKSNNIGVFPSTPSIEPATLSVAPVNEAAPPSPFRSSVIIVALTASSLQSDRVTALAAGCNDFLTKPVSLKWLERKIIEWGCMQALIDFEGWKRWNGTEKDSTKQGFHVGPLRAARNLAGKLHIDRKRTSTPPPARTPPSRTDSDVQINVRSATPQSSLDPSDDPSHSDPKLGSAATSLSAARTELTGRRPENPNDAAAAASAVSGPLDPSNTTGSPISPTRPTASQSNSNAGGGRPKSRPTTPRSEGRLSGSTSLRSIHETLEPSGSVSPETERAPSAASNGGGSDKPLPALPS